MGIDKELRINGYEFDEGRTERDAPAELWINRKAGLGIRLEWFRLRR